MSVGPHAKIMAAITRLNLSYFELTDDSRVAAIVELFAHQRRYDFPQESDVREMVEMVAEAMRE